MQHEVFDEALEDEDAFMSLVGKNLKESSTHMNCNIPYTEIRLLAKHCLHYAKFKRAKTAEVCLCDAKNRCSNAD